MSTSATQVGRLWVELCLCSAGAAKHAELQPIQCFVLPFVVDTITLLVWHDENADQIKQKKGVETGLPEVGLTVTDSRTGEVVSTAVTDKSGKYELPALEAGVRYTVTVDESTLPVGFVSTTGGGTLDVEYVPGEELFASFGYAAGVSRVLAWVLSFLPSCAVSGRAAANRWRVVWNPSLCAVVLRSGNRVHR